MNCQIFGRKFQLPNKTKIFGKTIYWGKIGEKLKEKDKQVHFIDLGWLMLVEQFCLQSYLIFKYERI